VRAAVGRRNATAFFISRDCNRLAGNAPACWKRNAALPVIVEHGIGWFAL